MSIFFKKKSWIQTFLYAKFSIFRHEVYPRLARTGETHRNYYQKICLCLDPGPQALDQIIVRKFQGILLSPLRLYSFPLKILFLGRVYNPAGQGSGFAFTIIPFVHLLPISPLSSFIPPFLVAIPPACFTVKTHPCPAPWPLFPRLHSLLARQVENPNEILKVWDLIFSPFTLLCLQLQLHEIIAARLATAFLTWHDIYIFANESRNTNKILEGKRWHCKVQRFLI